MKLIDFWAPWCGPCVRMNPVIEQLKTDYAGTLEIEKINVDENANVAKEYGVRSIPTFILIKDSHEVGRFVGATSINEMKSWVENITL